MIVVVVVAAAVAVAVITLIVVVVSICNYLVFLFHASRFHAVNPCQAVPNINASA